jgi:hypothetical protein
MSSAYKQMKVTSALTVTEAGHDLLMHIAQPSPQTFPFYYLNTVCSGAIVARHGNVDV